MVMAIYGTAFYDLNRLVGPSMFNFWSIIKETITQLPCYWMAEFSSRGTIKLYP